MATVAVDGHVSNISRRPRRTAAVSSVSSFPSAAHLVLASEAGFESVDLMSEAKFDDIYLFPNASQISTRLRWSPLPSAFVEGVTIKYWEHVGGRRATDLKIPSMLVEYLLPEDMDYRLDTKNICR